MGQTNDGKCGTPKTSEGETKFTADKFPNGFPRPDISTNAKLKAYKELLKAKIGKKLDNNDIVLGVNETDYTLFYLIPGNHTLKNHMDMHHIGKFSVANIDLLYRTSVRKIYFMVDGMKPNEKLTEYLANKKYRNLDNKDGLRVTEKELVAVLMRESNFKKTTFCFHGDPIPFSVVKEVLNLPVEYE